MRLAVADATVRLVGRWTWYACAAMLVAGCSTADESDSGTGVDTYGAPASTGDALPPSTASDGAGGATGGLTATSTSGPAGGSSSGGGSTSGDSPNFDLGAQPDMGAPNKVCPEDTFSATDNQQCAIDPVYYERDAGLLSLTIVKGQLYALNDDNVDVLLATEQVGYEGFFTIAREMDAPDVFYLIVADDDFMHLEPDGECGITLGACETDCMPGAGGDVCRAFTDDFIPIVASAYVGSPYTLQTFGRRTSPDGACCSDDFMCNASATSYSEHVVEGPMGTMHFIFQDGFAFLDRMGWGYTPLENVDGEAQFEFDLCSLPVPEG